MRQQKLLTHFRKKTWRRPTLTQPNTALTSALKRLTVLFGMEGVGPLRYGHQENSFYIKIITSIIK